MLEGLGQLVERGLFAPIDVEFGRFLAKLSGGPSWETFLAGVLTSRAVREGDVCLDLSGLFTHQFLDPETDQEIISIPDLKAWKESLLSSPVVGRPGDFTPLILDYRDRLYLYRYWEYERRLAGRLLELASSRDDCPDPCRLKQGLDALFPRSLESGLDWQRLAAFVGATRRLCVISGGPGTGKTTTISKVLALIIMQRPERPPKIALSAPTGKAASRLQEAVERGKSKFPLEISTRIPSEAKTIHRLLGFSAREGRFRYHRKNPLSYDVVVVDECSMVDLALMTSLVSALPRHGRLILVGDRDQLASVEAGAVLGDICAPSRADPFTPSFSTTYSEVSGEHVPEKHISKDTGPLADSIVQLQTAYRFGSGSSLPSLAGLINEGDTDGALNLLQDPSEHTVRLRTFSHGGELEAALRKLVMEEYGREIQETREPGELLRGFGAFRILCALRRGPYGVAGLNLVAQEILKREGIISARARHYHGRPILITKNDYTLGLYNGDVGVIAEVDGTLKAFFSGEGGALRELSPARLPEHQTAYAMTVHKAQGSEFDRVILILPQGPSPVVTRELIYTAVTRAKKSIEIWAPEEVFRAGVARPTTRTSGLSELLHEHEPGREEQT